MSQFSVRCEKHGIKSTAVYTGHGPETWQAQAYKVTLRFRGKRLTVPFYQGSGITREPCAADVLSCLLSDAHSYENARDFAEWAADLGFDPDSRKAESAYRACKTIARKLARFFDGANDVRSDLETAER